MSETPEKGRRNTWIIVAIVAAILLLLLCGCLAILGVSWLRGARTPFARSIDVSRIGRQLEERFEREAVFDVVTPVLLEISNDVGQVRVLGTEEREVRVEAVIRGYGPTTAQAREAMERVQVDIIQVADDHIRLVGDNPDGVSFGKSPTVDWTVRVPAEARIQLSNAVGDARIDHISGALLVKVDVGDVRVDEFTLTGDSQVATGVGEIVIGLPRESAFMLDAATNVGDIDIDFDIRAEEEGGRVPGDVLRGPVGDDPEGTLHVRTGTGDIDIRER